MKNYCENCAVLTDDARCPVCRRKKLRAPETGDMCFLTEREQIWSDVLEGALNSAGIPYLTKNHYGAGMALKIGPMFERVRFYVLFADYERASSVVDELFSQSGDAEDTEN